MIVFRQIFVKFGKSGSSRFLSFLKSKFLVGQDLSPDAKHNYIHFVMPMRIACVVQFFFVLGKDQTQM